MPYYSRLTYNSLDWKMPSGLEGKCLGHQRYLFECLAQFGFEEWYRSSDFQIEEEGEIWQYGYWQCFNDPNDEYAGNTLEDFLVYTKRCNGNCGKYGRCIKVARYSNIYVLSKEERSHIEEYFSESLDVVRNILLNNNVNVYNFDTLPGGNSRINIKFKLSDEIYCFNDEKEFQPSDFRFDVIEF